jgi:LysM repeat protein
VTKPRLGQGAYRVLEPAAGSPPDTDKTTSQRVVPRHTRAPRGQAAGIGQLLGSLVVTLISVSMLLGSFLLSQLDALGVRPPPTQAGAALSPSPTPFLPTITPTLTPSPTTSPYPPLPETETPVPPTLVPSASPTPPSPLIPSCPQPWGWIVYTVQRGDTLAGLALRVGFTTLALMQANCLSTPTIYPEQQIYLPPTFYASPTPRPYTCGPPFGWVVYIVQPGDTLYSLSLRFGVGIDAIRRANCMYDYGNYTIYTGQALYLPPLPPTPPSTPIPSLTPTPTKSPMPTSTPTPIPTEFPTLTPTPIPTFTPSPTPTSAATNTPTYTPTPTETPGPISTPTHTPTPTPTEPPTSTHTPTPTPTQPPTSTHTPTPTPTQPPTSTYTPTPTSTPSGG